MKPQKKAASSKPQKRAARPVTAQPRSVRDETLVDTAEEGLSIEPEQMGQSFLRYATGNQSEARGTPELHADGAPASDEPADGAHFSTDASIWENTASTLLEHGGTDPLNEQLADPALSDEEEDESEPARGVTEVDLTASVIEEASLLDEESSVLGETIPKQPRTDDTGSRGRRSAQDEDEGE